MSSKPLTPRQASIMAKLADLQDQTRAALIAATSLRYQLLDRELERLESHKLITRKRCGTTRVVQLSITMAGRRAMADHAEAARADKPIVVPPPTFRTSSIGVWPGRPAPYVRDTGKHIPSRGVAC